EIIALQCKTSDRIIGDRFVFGDRCQAGGHLPRNRPITAEYDSLKMAVSGQLRKQSSKGSSVLRRVGRCYPGHRGFGCGSGRESAQLVGLRRSDIDGNLTCTAGIEG